MLSVQPDSVPARTEQLNELQPSPENDSGLGLVEIVVSMFMMAILALSFLPLVIQSLNLSRNNVTLATATQLVSTQLDLARKQTATTASCANLTTFAAAVVPTTTDLRGVVLQPQRQVTCPGSYPGTASFVASVVQSGSSTVISTAKTLIYVATP